MTSIFAVSLMIMGAFYSPIEINSSNPGNTLMANPSNNNAAYNQVAANFTLSKMGSLFNYLNASYNYSTVEISSAYFSNSSTIVNILANGTAVVNNVSFSFESSTQVTNTTNSANEVTVITLKNQTYVSQDTSSYDRSWTNVTYFTFTQSTSDIAENSNSSYLTYSTFLNKSVEVTFSEAFKSTGPPKYTALPHPILETTYSNSTKAYYYNETSSVLNGIVVRQFETVKPGFEANGTISLVTQSNVSSITEGSISGYILNGTNVNNFTVAISNNNATLTVQSDPVNFSFDPQTFTRGIDGGQEAIALDMVSIPSSDLTTDAIIGVVVGIVGTAVAVASYFLPEEAPAGVAGILAFIGTIAAVVGTMTAVLTIYGNHYIASNGYLYIYLEIGMWTKWDWFWLTMVPYYQIGFHTNQITSLQYYGQIQYLNSWTYIPMVSLPTNTNSWHTSIWPNSFP